MSLGQDNYIIRVICLAGLPVDEAGLTPACIEESLDARQIGLDWKLNGNRLKDWKNGTGREELRRVLQNARPMPAAPVTLIQACVIGKVSERPMLASPGCVAGKATGEGSAEFDEFDHEANLGDFYLPGHASMLYPSISGLNHCAGRPRRKSTACSTVETSTTRMFLATEMASS